MWPERLNDDTDEPRHVIRQLLQQNVSASPIANKAKTGK